MGRLAAFVGRPARIGSHSTDFLGRSITGGRAWFFFREKDRGIILAFAPIASGLRGFRTGRRLVVQSFFFPGRCDGDDLFEDRLGALLLQREDEVADAIAASDTSCSVPPPDIDALPERDHLLGLRVLLPESASRAHIVVDRAGILPLTLADWSADIRLPPGDPEPTAVRIVQDRFLAVVAHMLSGGQFRFSQEVANDRPLPGSHTVLLLGDPKGNRSRLAAARPEPDRILFVLLNLPSVCRQYCDYCVAGGNPSWKKSSGNELDDLDGMLPRLQEMSAEAAEVRIELGGNDPLESPHFLEILARVAPLANPPGVIVITPGTRLADPAFVRAIASIPGGERTGFHLTVLGPDASTHDRMAGRTGAWNDLNASLQNLRDNGLIANLCAVVARGNVAQLPATLAWIESHGLRACVAAFCEDGRSREDSERHYVPYPELRALFDAHRDLVDRTVHCVRHVPYCLFSDWIPAGTPGGDVSRPQQGIEFPPRACLRCIHFATRCPSVGGPQYVVLHDVEWLSPVLRIEPV